MTEEPAIRNSSDRVVIFDTTLRDGEQTPGATLSVEEKVEIAHALARLGVDVLEAGFPISSPGDFEAVRRIAETVEGPVIAGLARANGRDIYRAWEALSASPKPRIHTFLATSDIHLTHKLRLSREECLRTISEMVALARSLTDDVEFSPEDATRTQPSFLTEAVQVAAEAGATTVNIPDTVGYATPGEFGRLIASLRAGLPEHVILSVHCHDDLGLAVANSLSGVEAGARQVECTINGLGERAGNASLEEVVMALAVRGPYYGTGTGIRTKEIAPTSRLVAGRTGIPVQPNKAIVGANAFAHEAGIHQDGMLKNPLTYEIMRPEDVGLEGSKLVLGKLSGRHAFRVRLEEMGYRLTAEELQRAFERFKALCDRKVAITPVELARLAEAELAARAGVKQWA